MLTIYISHLNHSFTNSFHKYLFQASSLHVHSSFSFTPVKSKRHLYHHVIYFHMRQSIQNLLSPLSNNLHHINLQLSFIQFLWRSINHHNRYPQEKYQPDCHLDWLRQVFHPRFLKMFAISSVCVNLFTKF